MALDVGLTLADAERLYGDKIQQQRKEMAYAERQTQEAVSHRDKALQDIGALQRDKDKAINELSRINAEADQVRASLAEHRKNVETSLNAQEVQARKVIDEAAEVSARVAKATQVLKQRQAQLDGIKQTLIEESAKLNVAFAQFAEQTQQKLTAIPDLSLE